MKTAVALCYGCFFMEMYFIALVAPDHINTQAQKWKEYFLVKYGCSVALRSPAHITIIPPFRMDEKEEDVLLKMVENFSISWSSFQIRLKNFSSFEHRVLFIDVEPNETLNRFAVKMQDAFSSSNFCPVKKDNRPFHPHVTLAARDLYKKAFYESWDLFSCKKYIADWQVTGISVLKHNGKKWDVINTSHFNNIIRN